jgi:hypothetical protein
MYRESGDEKYDEFAKALRLALKQSVMEDIYGSKINPGKLVMPPPVIVRIVVSPKP